MPKIPSLTSRKVIQVLKKIGFVEDRQKGSHLVLIKKPLLRAIINDAKLSVDEFLKLL